MNAVAIPSDPIPVLWVRRPTDIANRTRVTRCAPASSTTSTSTSRAIVDGRRPGTKHVLSNRLILTPRLSTRHRQSVREFRDHMWVDFTLNPIIRRSALRTISRARHHNAAPLHQNHCHT